MPSADSASTHTDITVRFRAAIDRDRRNPNASGSYRPRTGPDLRDPSTAPSVPPSDLPSDPSSNPLSDPTSAPRSNRRSDPTSYRTSDPTSNLRSPVDEPSRPHHQPGDTWLIDRARPRDVLDPGPYGTPGWFPDRRTGRHRRFELPDPATREAIEADPLMSEWADKAEALLERRSRSSRRPRPTPGPGGSGRPTTGAAETDPQTSRSRRTTHSDPEAEAPYRFSKLRELAWRRFLDKSELLASAHIAERSSIEREGGWAFGRLVRQIKWIASVIKGPKPEPEPEPGCPPSQDPPPPPRPRPGSQMARAIRGAQAGRAAAAQARRAGSGYVEEWERQFDSRRNLSGLAVLGGNRVAGGAAWA